MPATRASAPALSTGQEMPGLARLGPAAVEGLAPAQGGAGKGVCAEREGRRNERVGLARLDPLAAPQGGRPDKTGPATVKNCTGGQTGGGVSPPYRCAQRRKRGEEGVGPTRLDPRTALQGGRPDKTGPAELRIRRGAWGKGRVGLPRLDPLRPGGGGAICVKSRGNTAKAKTATICRHHANRTARRSNWRVRNTKKV